MKKQKMQNSNKGITLIALVITIIVMLILVAVTISMAINGGLFQKAGEAVGDTQNKIDEEQILASGRVQIDGVWYDSIDDYLTKSPSTNQGNGTEEETETETEEEETETVTLKVGDYVNYTPTTGTYVVASGEKGSGYTANQTFTTETGDNALKWRVLSIDETTGEIELISATAAQVSTTLYLQGANGYNHAVDILNDLCEKLYSNSNGATARSITVEDINEKTTYNYTGFTNYNKLYTPTNKNYPNIYAAELGSTANGLDETADLLEGSDRVEKGTVNASGVTEYTKYTGSSTADTLYTTFTIYTYKPESYLKTTLGINNAPAGLLHVGTYYWIATRCAHAYDDQACFNVRFMVPDGTVAYHMFYTSYGNDDTATPCNIPVRPVVALGTNASLTLDKTNTTEEVTYWNIEF